MYNIILVIVGIILFGYGLFIHTRFLGLVKKTPLRKWWIMLLVLVVFFASSYIIFAYWLMGGVETISINALKTLVSFVFFFGAIFVVITISLIHSTIKDLTKEREGINRLQMEKIALLQNKEIELEKEVQGKTKELQKAKIDLEKKVMEQTSVLKGKLDELKEINSLMVGRELKMAEIKKENEEMKKRLGEA